MSSDLFNNLFFFTETENIMSRVKKIRDVLKLNKTELARLLKVSPSAVSEFESGVRNPSKKFIFSLAAIGVNIDWFLTGEGEIFNTNKLTGKPNEKMVLLQKGDKSTNTKDSITLNPALLFKNSTGVPLIYESSEGFKDGIAIPLLENAASAGYGNDLDDDDTPVRYVQVPRHLSKFPHLASLPVKGDSMEPTLHDGDLVVCDGGGWDGDGIYVLKTHDTSYVKRVQLKSDGYRVISDNKMYESITESAESLSIVGKVRAILVIVPGRRGGI